MTADRTLLTAEQVMQRNVVTLAPDQGVLDAVQTLLQKRISGAPVVEDGKIRGMFSERDCLTVVAAAAYEAEPSGTVAQHMRRQFHCVSPDTDLFHVAELFHDYPIRRLPVVDCDGNLVGLVSRGDTLCALQQVYCARKAERPKNSYERIQEHLEAH
ncbi:MAG: CBS domain-containing protein [Planctomycetota bacterium]